MNKGKLCISVCARTADEMIESLRRASELVDIVEVRFDSLEEDAEIEKLLKLLPHKERLAELIATFRSPDQGGLGGASYRAREAFWSRDLTGFSLVDMESDMLDHLTTDAKTIGSFHDFEAPPSDLASIIDVLVEHADVVKVAAGVTDAADAIPIWQSLGSPAPMIPIAMGDAGKWTRILGLPHGAFLTYASLDEGAETADGQITARDMVEVYRVKELDLETKVYGIIGNPVSSSLSPYFQNAAFRETGLNSVFIPLLVKDLDEFIRRMVLPATREVELNFAGFSVTMPHKLTIMKHLHESDPVAEQVGAVNTVVIRDGRLIGYNTDAHGFITPLKKEFGDLKGARVAVSGAGGAARACCYALTEEGAEITVLVRNPDRATDLHNQFGVEVGELQSGILPTGFDIVVNATPIGMRGPLVDEVLFTADQLSGVRFVFDLVTRPDDTPLMGEARLAGIPTIGGARMLLAQGMKQFELWTSREAPADIMKDVLTQRLSAKT